MSHIAVKKILFEPTPYAGNNWFFEFLELPKTVKEKRVVRFATSLYREIKDKTQAWDAELNTEWLVRHYMALKMIFSASLMLSSAEYAYRKNIRITDGYLQYYALFSSLRAILFTDPRTQLNNGELFETTHSKTITVATNIISSISKEQGSRIKNYVSDLKDIREIYSYGAPSSGSNLYQTITEVNFETTVSICKLLVEVAQLQSEILEKSIDKHYSGEFELLSEVDYIKKYFEYPINDKSLIDPEDSYRLSYFFRKWPRSTNLLCMVSEGHVEDFFGAWVADEEYDADAYNPDENWRIIFPFP